MFIIITLFYLSLVTIAGMVGWKIVSLRSLKLSLVEGIESELHGKFYDIAHMWWDVFRDTYWARARAFALTVFYVVAHEVLRVALIVGQKLRRRLSTWLDMVKGKGVIKNKGSASFFLRNIAEHKKIIKSEIM
jgi:hypothetical protein